MDKKPRCSWANPKNEKYLSYHDNEWGSAKRRDDGYLFEMLLLESFQAGLSWECVLNKRENFRRAFDGFDYHKICLYDAKKREELCRDAGIIRNKRKIQACVDNAEVFIKIQQEYGSFSKYIWGFTNNQVIYENNRTNSELSDKISRDLQARGMKFVGSTIVYSYLQAIGVIYSHEDTCYLCRTVKK